VTGEETDDVMVPSVRNDPEAVWISLHKDGSLQSLLDEEDLEEDED
jgi:hypothetical protein